MRGGSVRAAMRCYGGRVVVVLVVVGSVVRAGVAQERYRLPPQVVVDILDAAPLPLVSVGPGREWLVLGERRSMPGIVELAQPMLRLAGNRINPRTNGPFAPSEVVALKMLRVSDVREREVAVPRGGLSMPFWAPDGSRFAFTRTTESGMELWVGDPATGGARALTGPELNGAGGRPCVWMPEGTVLLCRFVPEGRGAPPPEPAVPVGPVVQETRGRTAPVRTYQDLLEDAHDEALYDYYFTAQLAYVDVGTGARRPVGAPAVFDEVEPSPDGRYLLVVRTVRPYSYLVPDGLFPKEVEIWDREGRLVRKLANLPLAEEVPIGGVRTGPRSFSWRPLVPATLVYVEALDGGDPRKRVEHRDRVLMLPAPFDGEPVELARTEYRFAGLRWGAAGGLALLGEFDRPKRWTRTWIVDAGRPGAPVRKLWDRSAEDSYGDPGQPVMRTTPRGELVMRQRGDWIYLTGAGASPEGERPFLDRLNLKTLKTERLFRSAADAYETVVAVLDDEGRRVVTRSESKVEPPNYYVRDLGRNTRTALTAFKDPHPQLSGVTKQLVVYRRADGVQLSGALYLPPGYTPGQRLPVVIWAYPREFADPDAAGQVRGSPNRFTLITGASHLFFLTQGYAVFDGPSMPILGGDTANNTYVEQLVASAQAAVDKLVEMGVADPERIGVGGHSYGAFMTANLLAHTDLFRAGIARSGAYNRTLTPFGFQNEERTFWQAPQVYFRMSPFMYADSIDEPILLIHGEADNNSGTFPIQSERLYHALKGLGGTARLVMLPHESHGYQGRESVLHTVAEMLDWFDKYVKNAGPRRVTEGRR